MHLKVYVDFDGTVTRQDVGNAFFRRFAGPVYDDLLVEYLGERITAQECFRRGAAAIGTLSLAAVREFIEEQEIDPGFTAFVRYCRRGEIPLAIVSDGLDLYIRGVLEHHGVPDVPFFSNTVELAPEGAGDLRRPVLRFPHANPECGRCACCKRNVILSHASDDEIIVYVGEGYSDFCPAQYADIVFAKDDLQKFCQKENISYFLYRTFDDVVGRLERLKAGKPPRKRARAEAKRREAFIRE